MLVADSLRLGGAILGQYPDMLAPQLVGRLLSEMDNNKNIRSLLRQCDEEGLMQNALVPTYHCMHTPGGPLKYSLEGHQVIITSLVQLIFVAIGTFVLLLQLWNKFKISLSFMPRTPHPP